MTNYVEVNGVKLPVSDYARVVDDGGNDTGERIPIIKTMSDFGWQLGCLKSRLEQPENYDNKNYDIKAEIEYLVEWLADNITAEAVRHYLINEKNRAKYEDCFELICRKLDERMRCRV